MDGHYYLDTYLDSWDRYMNDLTEEEQNRLKEKRSMNTITIDRIAIERRHREFTYAGLGEDQDLYAAAVGYLIRAGWRWMPDSYSPKAGYGWWILPNDERYGRPMGDSRDFRRGGYRAVQLYTECGIEAIQASAAEYRADRMAKMRGSCSVTNDQEGRE